MPGWDTHYAYARNRGFPISKAYARLIDRFLDKPSAGGYRLPHRFLHNEMGLKLVEAIFGPWPALRYAEYHLELDRKARDPEWKPLIRYGKFRDNVKVPKIQPPSPGAKVAMLLRIGLLLAAMFA